MDENQKLWILSNRALVDQRWNLNNKTQDWVVVQVALPAKVTALSQWEMDRDAVAYYISNWR